MALPVATTAPTVSLLGNFAIHTAGHVNSNSLTATDTTVIYM